MKIIEFTHISDPLILEMRQDSASHQTILENISVDSAAKSIVSTADSITKVYDEMKNMAEKWANNYGNLRGFQRNAGGIGKRWYNTFFWNKMDSDLRTLLIKEPKKAAALRKFFDLPRDDKGHISFTKISEELPYILYEVGKNLNLENLQRFAANWSKKHSDYEQFLADVQANADTDDGYDDAPKPRQPKDRSIAQQNQGVEDLVNQVLSSLPKKVAGDIRNAIAREGNKLKALERELAKRDIKFGESLDTESIFEKKKKRKNRKSALWGPGPYGSYGHDTGFSGDGGVGEASYPGNIGFMEIAKFFKVATDEQKKLFQDLMDREKKGLAWKLIQDVTDTKLQGKEFDDKS